MGTHVIKMPDIGEGIAQVELVEWFVKVGDMVREDQVVADVMTDKATAGHPLTRSRQSTGAGRAAWRSDGRGQRVDSH